MFKNEKLDVILFFILIAIQLAGFYALLHHFEWKYLAIMIPIYLWMGFGTTLYMHRYLTHRGMEMPGWLKFFFAMSTSVGLSGDPVTWVGDHRYHHLKSDTDEDIHSPLHGFPYAHMLWLVKKPEGFRERSLRYASDVRKIWYCKLFENRLMYVLPHIAVAAALWFTLGPAGMLWCLYFPMMVLYNFTWAVNSICHLPSVGYRTFETTDHSRNNFWVSLGALGEGFHNNHHAHPKCAAHGLSWWEFDPTKYLIWLLEKFGLAWKVAWPKTEAALSETEVKDKAPAAPAQALLAKMIDPDRGLASASE
ncbi:MAG TPA: acyl-CoA desaturase [Chthoniobacterales bacterium]